MWIPLTESDVKTALSGPEFAAYTTKALSDGQGNPLTEIMPRVIKRVRGYVAGSRKNQLGAGLTIPEELESETVTLIAWELASRLPLPSNLTERLREKKEDAEALLERVAQGNFGIEQPATATDEVIGGGDIKVVHKRPSITGRDNLSGL